MLLLIPSKYSNPLTRHHISKHNNREWKELEIVGVQHKQQVGEANTFSIFINNRIEYEIIDIESRRIKMNKKKEFKYYSICYHY